MCLISHVPRPHGQESQCQVWATANETLPRAFVQTANPVYFQNPGSKRGVSVDTFSVCFVMLVFVGLENQQPGTAG